MIRKEYASVVSENARGGKGSYLCEYILEKEELLGHGRGFGRFTYKPGVSIGMHRHFDEFEIYYVVSGEGTFFGDDGKPEPIKAGECGIIGVGEAHALENTSDKDMEVIFLLINAEGKTEGYAENA